jgi:hypothetical protein
MMRFHRRSFFGILGAVLLDPELLWTPSTTTISIPRPVKITVRMWNKEAFIRSLQQPLASLFVVGLEIHSGLYARGVQ